MTVEACLPCEGHWFDSVALDLLLAKRSSGRNLGASQDFMSLPFSEPSELQCPRCSEFMLTGTRVGISVEWCRHCKGIFLDKGELERIVEWREAQQQKERAANAKASASVATDAVLIALGSFLVNRE